MVSARRLMRLIGSLILGFASLLLVAGAGAGDASGSTVSETVGGSTPAVVAPDNADLSNAAADAGPQLQRFVGQPDYSFHWATTDPSEIPAAFLPDILEFSWNLTSGGAGQVPLYDCQQSGQPGNYISTTADCSDGLLDGQSVTQDSGLQGYLYTTPSPGGTATEAIYRCFHVIEGAPDYFLSPDPNCERSGVATLLGYSPDDAPPPSLPGAPAIGTATGGNAEATVTFGPPADDGGGGINGYTVTATDVTNSANGGQSATGSESPISVTGLTNGDSYTFSVTATNSAGTGPPSNASNTVQIGEAPAITSANNLTTAAGSAFTYSVTTTGAPVSAIAVASESRLPTGVTLKDNADGTATLSGTDGVAVGDYAFSIQASNGISPDATQSFALTVQNLPTTSILVPSRNATLSASTALDASASNATSVEFLLFGGSFGFSPMVVCTATQTIYGWACAWNSTTVPNGTYTVVSYASGPGGSMASSGVGIKVNNPVPTTSVLVPSKGTSLSGSTILDASASNATSVSFVLFGGSYGYNGQLLGTATLTPYGWIYTWNSTSVPNGSYTLCSLAANSLVHTFSSGVGVTVHN
jgi:hypothetical protein